MAKHKKAKVVSINAGKLSPENYIKTQARNLPVVECLISKEWENTGVCNIVVARGHKTGNLTVGIYLIDTYCLGLKDTYYEFNITPSEFNRFTDDVAEMEDCDYVTAHNIIYGAIAYAEDYGFNPHKDFAVAQFILKEDNDDVPLIEIDFGLNGLPCYMSGPFDSEARIKSIEATLTRTAGPGNYNILSADDFGDDLFDEEDDEMEYDEDEALDESGLTVREIITVLEQINKLYDENIRTPQAKDILENSTLGKKYEITNNPVDTSFTQFDSTDQEEYYNSIYKKVFYDDEPGPAIKELQKTIKSYPDKAVFYNLLQCAYIINNQPAESDDVIIEMYKLFPDYLFAKIAYANMLMDINQFDMILPVFNGKSDLNALYPERKIFHISETTAYYSTLCRYFVGVDNIDSADLYMNAILKNEITHITGQTIITTAIKKLINAKMKKLAEAGLINLEE